MAIKINEEKMIEQHAQMYEERVHSPVRRFTDKTFTPCRYWHINGDKTTLDRGWKSSSGVVGKTSSIRYNLIDNLPLCGIETILPQIQSGEAGLDTSYEGEAVTMDGTIRPYENDFFMITYLKSPWIFRVTSVEYDNLVSSSIFKIQFTLEYIDATKVDELMKQTVKEYVCIIENIGTDERCIIEKSEINKIDKINVMYDQIKDTYINFYYNERYNCFLADFENGFKLYDPFHDEFISRHRLLTHKSQIDGIVLTDQFKDSRREIKYQRTIYRCVELKRIEYLNTFGFNVFDGITNPQTAFCRWRDRSVSILDVPLHGQPHTHTILSDEFVDAVKLNGPVSTIHADLIKRYLRGDELVLSDIDLSLHDDILDMYDANLEVFFIAPIIMYIIRQIIHVGLTRSKDAGSAEHFI